MQTGHERRRVQRVRLLEPLRGTIGAHRVFVIDASLRGVRIAHQEAIGRVGETFVLHAEWDGRVIELRCDLICTHVHRLADSLSARTLYHAGAVIVAALGTSAMVLREIVQWHVERAVDEQIANAHGIPAIAAQSFQTGKTTHFKRHEFVFGHWRETPTADPAQPENGFTIAADHSLNEVEMLRAAFERSGPNGGRDLIKKLAQISISTPDGIPTRRFVP